MPPKSMRKYPQAFKHFYKDSDGLPSNGVNALLRRRGEIWAGTEAGIARFRKGKWELRSGRGWPDGNVEKLFSSSKGVILALCDGEALTYAKGRWSKNAGPSGLVAAAEDQIGMMWALADDGLWCLDGGAWQLKKRNGDRINFTDFIWQRKGRGVASSTDGLFFLQGKRYYWYIVEAHEEGLISKDVRSLREDSRGNIWAATDRGISIYRPPNGWCSLTGPDGLPIEELTKVETGPEGTLWFGSANGLLRLKEGRWKYYASKRYLPDDRVNWILPGPQGDVWVATPAGISHIGYREMSLSEKADHYAKTVERYHKRRGYVTLKWLEEEGNLDTGHVEISDNDGTWTGIYLAAQSFRYAVTKDQSVRRLVSESLNAMLYLEQVTGIPGLPARAVRIEGEHGFGDGHPEWHRTADGKTEWKAETSSDEIDAHFFSLSICYDLAANDKERKRIRDMVARVTDYIIDNDYLLIDLDGKPTTWGVWSPDLLNNDDRWRMQQGLNSLEIISHLKTAYHITGDEKYQSEYNKMVKDHHYALNSIKQRITILGHHTWHDDQLAMLSYYPLLLYEKDPDLRQVLLLGLERTWQDLREMQYSLWNFMYGAVTGKSCDVEAGVKHLADLPLDLVRWNIKNSVRADLKRDPENPDLVRVPIDADERTVENSDGCMFRIDGGRNGRVAQDGTIYLLPYWMARYHGLIDA